MVEIETYCSITLILKWSSNHSKTVETVMKLELQDAREDLLL